MPPIIEEQIDCDGDKTSDFVIRFDTEKGTAVLTVQGSSVVSVDHVYRLKKGWAVRVLLRK